MRWVTGFLAIVIATPAAAQQIEVTLNEAVQRALQVQPAMVQARGTQRNSGAARTSAWAAFLPSVTFGGSASKNSLERFDQNSNKLIPPIPNYASSLSANINLITGVGQLANIKAANATLDAAEAGIITQRFRTELDTKQAFYNASANEDLVRVAESQVVRARQQLQISIDKLHAGSATRSDSLRSTVDYGNARIALLEAQANLATAQANLGRQIGVDQSVRAVPDSVLPPLPDTAALRTAAIEGAPQVEQADAQARAAGSQVSIIRSQYLPSIIASIGNAYTGVVAPWTTTNAYASGWNAGVTVRWTLFNGFIRERSLTNAKVARDVAVARAADVRRQVSAQFTQELAALTTAYE